MDSRQNLLDPIEAADSSAWHQAFFHSDFYRMLVKTNWLLPAVWQESGAGPVHKEGSPRLYPSEWPFSMFKDASLHLLLVQRAALEAGATLTDVSPSDIVF